MPNVGEWLKGILTFLTITMIYYFLWNTVFSGIINFVATDVFNLSSTSTVSILIMKTTVWLSFTLLYLSTGGGFLIYSIVAGSRNDAPTKPLELFKAIGIWCVSMPILTFLYGLTYYMTTILDATNIISSSLETQANQFAWLLALIYLVILTAVPFYFVLKGYGVELFNEQKG